MAEYFLKHMRPWVPSAPPDPPNGVTVGLWPALSTYPASHDGPSTSPVRCPLTVINSTARRCLVCQLRKQAPRGSGGHKRSVPRTDSKIRALDLPEKKYGDMGAHCTEEVASFSRHRSGRKKTLALP